MTVLAKGLNFTLAPEKIPVEEFIVQTERAFNLLPAQEREPPMADMSPYHSHFMVNRMVGIDRHVLVCVGLLSKYLNCDLPINFPSQLHIEECYGPFSSSS